MTAWASAPLSELCDIRIGKTPARKTPEYWAPGVAEPWVTISDLNQGRLIRTSKEHVSQVGIRATRMRLVPEGTLLLSFKLSIGKVGIAAHPLYTNEAIAALADLSARVDRDYLYWSLQHIDLLETSDRAAKGKTLNKAKLGRVPVPLPPLPEQRRIAAILDKADALRQKRREAIAKLDQLLQSVFLEMFGDPVTNPKGFEKQPIGDLIKVKSGDGLTANDMVEDGEYPVYGGNGINGFHNQYRFEDSQIVIGRVGVNCGAVHLTRPKCWVTDNALFVSHYYCSIDKVYLQAALVAAKLNQYASRSAQPLISGSRINPVPILYPPQDLQAQFHRQVSAIKRMETVYGEVSDKTETFFQACQQRAFKG